MSRLFSMSSFLSSPLLPIGIIGGLLLAAFLLRHFIVSLIFNVMTALLDLIDARHTKFGRRITAIAVALFLVFTLFLSFSGRWQAALTIYVILAILGLAPRGLIRGALTILIGIGLLLFILLR